MDRMCDGVVVVESEEDELERLFTVRNKRVTTRLGMNSSSRVGFEFPL